MSGQTGNQTSDYTGFESSVNSWTVAGAASWTLFDGLGIPNRINEAAANLDVQKANEDQIRNSVALDVHNAYLNLKSVIETIGSAEGRMNCRRKITRSLHCVLLRGSGPISK